MKNKTTIKTIIITIDIFIIMVVVVLVDLYCKSFTKKTKNSNS